MRSHFLAVGCALSVCTLAATATDSQGPPPEPSRPLEFVSAAASGRELFERETFGGNGRTCRTCHSTATGTVSPEDAQERFAADPTDALFLADGSDDGLGNGVTRMLTQATIRMQIALPENVTLISNPGARSVIVNRGIPTTLNTPALDPVLMYDGRQPDLPAQALGAIRDHAQPARVPTESELQRISDFQRTTPFFSSETMRRFAQAGVVPILPAGRTASEKRGRRFFEDLPFNPTDPKPGMCATCHSGPMLNETNEFIPVPPFARGGRFQSILVSELNVIGNPVHTFEFTNPDGTIVHVSSPDPGRALVTGDANDPFQSLNAFKIPTLWGAARTAPYFHDNSAKTLDDVMRHYQLFFRIVTALPAGGALIDLTDRDIADAVAYMKLLR